MSAIIHLNEQCGIVSAHLKKTYNIDNTTLPELDKFLKVSLRGIISLKIWREELNKTMPAESFLYMDEIISDLNQIIILSTIGFKIPACILIRHSLENICRFVYYKDHPVEQYQKELEPAKSRNLKISDIKQYIEGFPFEMIYGKTYESEKLNGVSSEVMKLWKSDYEKLSYFVHATNSNYFELNKYLEDIKPDNNDLVLIEDYVKNLITIVNTICLLMFFKNYQKISEEDKKTFIRNAIDKKGNFKKDLKYIFDEI